MNSNYQNLIVWKKSIELVGIIYELTKDFPTTEIYGLTSQMRRSAVSISSNIAEGSQRKTRKDFAYFLRNSKGSTAELETQLIISNNLNYIRRNNLYEKSLVLLLETRKMLSSLESSILSN